MACAAWTTCCFGRGDSAAAVGVTGQNFIYETPPTLSLEYIARRARTHTHLLCTHRLARLLLFSFVYISLLFGEHILTYIRHWPGNRLLFSANKLKQHRYTRRTCCFILLLERVLLLTQLHPLHNTRTPIYTPFLRYPDAVFPPLVEKLKVGSHFAPPLRPHPSRPDCTNFSSRQSQWQRACTRRAEINDQHRKNSRINFWWRST